MMTGHCDLMGCACISKLDRDSSSAERRDSRTVLSEACIRYRVNLSSLLHLEQYARL